MIGGSLNQSGPLLVRVTHASGESALSQIARLVSEAEGSKLPIQVRITLLNTVIRLSI